MRPSTLSRADGFVPGVRKIAVLRANAIGDFIFSLPALEALRLTYPDAEITLLGQSWHAGLLNGRPGPVDRVIVVPPCRGVSLPDDVDPDEQASELERFFEEMQSEEFDIAFQMHGGGRYSNPFVRRLGAKLSVGLKTPDAQPLDRWLPYVYFQAEIIRYLEVVSLVGAQPATLEPRIEVTGSDLAESLAVVPEGEGPLVALHPGAGDPMRRWPPDKFAALGDALAARGARIVVTGGREDERLIAESVVARMEAPVRNLWGKLSLGGLAGLLSRCDLVVSNDSGPMHLAGAVGTPTAGIYWIGNLVTAAPVTRGRHRPIISYRLNCPLCGQDTITAPCKHRASFVADIKVQEVLAPALELLAEP